MDYFLKLCSGGWCPTYYGKEPEKGSVTILKADELVSIPLNHPDIQRLFRFHYHLPPNRRFRIRTVPPRPKKDGV